MAKTNIEWTQHNYNPFYGCRRISDGCKNCYAEQIAGRFSGTDKNGAVLPYSGITEKKNGASRWTGEVKLNEEVLLAPLKRKTPTVYFVNSMSDTFYSKFPDTFIDRLFAVMALCPQHTFQILTKRAERMRDYLNNPETRFRIGEEIIGICNLKSGTPYDPVVAANYIIEAEDSGVLGKTENANDYLKLFPLPNVHLGVSCENQKEADKRIPLLLETPAAIRWLSCEPLLERLTLHNYFYTRYEMSGLHHETNKIDWVVVGGESGQNARSCNIDWIRSIVRQCQSANVPVFVKQLGAFSTVGYYDDLREKAFDNDDDWIPLNWALQNGQPPPRTLVKLPLKNRKGGIISEFPQDLQIREFPKQ